jgi:uncharacterized membrane protein YozB (DUF420 family)
MIPMETDCGLGKIPQRVHRTFARLSIVLWTDNDTTGVMILRLLPPGPAD